MAIFTHVLSHDMRHTCSPQVDGGQQDPREKGRPDEAYKVFVRISPSQW